MNKKYLPNSLKLGLTLAVSVCALFATIARAELQFQFTYIDQGTGFDDPLEGTARKQSLDEAAQITAGFFPNLTGTVVLEVDGSDTDDSTLASAASEITDFCNIGFDDRGDVGVIALGGADPHPGLPDGSVSVNFEDVVWDLDDNISSNSFDFKSTLIHELLHALGFSGSLGEEIGDACGTLPPSPGGYEPFDKYIGDSTGVLINNDTAVMDGDRWTAAITGGTGENGLLWLGPSGIAANGGQAIPLCSPNPFSPGSSIAHLDDDFFTSQVLVMESFADVGQGTRTLSDIEMGIMIDIGIGEDSGSGGSGDTALAPTGQANGNLAAGETDSYSIAITESGKLEVSSSGGLDLVGTLSLGSQQVASDDDGGVNVNFQLSVDVSTGTYTLAVEGFDESVSGSYSLSSSFTASGTSQDCPRSWTTTSFSGTPQSSPATARKSAPPRRSFIEPTPAPWAEPRTTLATNGG